MSEPLSSSDIEDVVSSVRRLVSPEARPRPVSRDLGVDRLILTPALRIVAEQSGSGPALVKLEAVPKRPRKTARRERSRLIPGSILAEDGSEILPPAAGPLASESLGLASSLSEIALVAEVAEPVAPEVTQEPVAADPPEPRPVAKAGKAAKSGKTSAEVQPGPAKTKARRVTSAKSKTLAEPNPDSDPPAGKTARTRRKPSPVAGEKASADVPTVEVDMADLDTGVEKTEAGSDSPSTETIVHHGLTDAQGNPISLLDEEQLILLLRRVIREELQGGLGEKITRNVRKLVRAEINRALAAETLD